MNEMEDSLSARRAMVYDLLNLGLFADENGVISARTKTKLLEILGFGNWERSRDADEAHLAKAERENFELRTRDIAPDVMDHTKLCVSAPCEKNEKFHARVSAHINKHKELASLAQGVAELEKRMGGADNEKA